MVALDGRSPRAEDIPDIESVKDSFRQRGGSVYHTAEHGSVRFLLAKDRVEVLTFRNAP